MRKTIKQLEVQLADAEKKYEQMRGWWSEQRDLARSLETELAEVKKNRESDRWMINGEQHRRGVLEGYQQRVREEDAKTLGKLWQEAAEFTTDQFGNRVPR